MRTVYPSGKVVVDPDEPRVLCIGMNTYRIEQFILDGHYDKGYGRIEWVAWAKTPYGPFCIAEGYNYDYVLKKMNEFVGEAA